MIMFNNYKYQIAAIGFWWLYQVMFIFLIEQDFKRSKQENQRKKPNQLYKIPQFVPDTIILNRRSQLSSLSPSVSFSYAHMSNYCTLAFIEHANLFCYMRSLFCNDYAMHTFNLFDKLLILQHSLEGSGSRYSYP